MPAFAVAWADRAGNLIDFTDPAYTLSARLVHRFAGTIALVKTTGITKAATSPNLILVWAPGELDVTPGDYRLHVSATYAGSGDRLFKPGDEPVIRILPAITAPAVPVDFEDGGSPSSTYDGDTEDGGSP